MSLPSGSLQQIDRVPFGMYLLSHWLILHLLDQSRVSVYIHSHDKVTLAQVLYATGRELGRNTRIVYAGKRRGMDDDINRFAYSGICCSGVPVAVHGTMVPG